MNYKQISIIIIIFIIIGSCSYVTWKYYYYKPNKIILPQITTNIESKIETKLISNNINPYFEISIGEKYLGRIIFQLFDDDVPKTCMNFRFLCSNNKLSYKDSIIHRVIKDFMIQGGDITNGDGTGGISMYGNKFNDESFNLIHNQPGILSMANSGPNTNNSQFFITLKETPWLDNKHVVFGIILSGFDIIKKIENIDVNENDKPLQNIIISECGLI